MSSTPEPATARIRRVTVRMARHLQISPPALVVTDDVSGGAAIVGIRRPVLLLDRSLATSLDSAELRGVVGHELAHVARRDNLLAFVAGLVGDIAFFVPMRRWMLRRLCEEREFAADQMVVAATRRPGALASGLLKAMDRSGPAALGSAALVDGVTVVQRVEALVAPSLPPAPMRGAIERIAVGMSLGLVLVGAAALPDAAGGSSGMQGLGVLWRNSETAAASAPETPDARAFGVYRGVALTAVRATNGLPILDDDPWDFHPGVIRACADHGSCPAPSSTPTLGLRPRPRVRVDTALARQWTAEHILGDDARVSLIRLRRSEH